VLLRKNGRPGETGCEEGLVDQRRREHHIDVDEIPWGGRKVERGRASLVVLV